MQINRTLSIFFTAFSEESFKREIVAIKTLHIIKSIQKSFSSLVMIIAIYLFSYLLVLLGLHERLTMLHFKALLN